MAINDRFAKIEQLVAQGRQIYDRIAAELIVLRGEVHQPPRQAVPFQLPQANGSNATHAQASTRQQQQQSRTFQEQPNPPRTITATPGQNTTGPRQIRYVRLGATPADNANTPNPAPAATPATTPRQPNSQQQVANGTHANATQPTAKATQKKPANQGIRARIIPPEHVQQLQQHMARREEEQRQNQPRRSNAAEHGRYSHEAVERAHSEARTGRGRTPAHETERQRTPSPSRRSGRGRTPSRPSDGRQRSPNTTDRRDSRGRTPTRESIEREHQPAKKDERGSRGKTPVRQGTGNEQPVSSKTAKRRADDAPAASSKKPKSREFVDSTDTSRSPSPRRQQAATPEAVNDPTVRKYTRKRAAPPARRPSQPPPPPPTNEQPSQEGESDGNQPPGPSSQPAASNEYDPANPGGVFANEPVDLAADTYLSDETESESEQEPEKNKSGSEQGNEDDELDD
ncbi:hypothetical protein AAVH_15269 [Aphelenchoides avenae]|nr:hypothetical protein AAVH_15269 [Aphelenchus avenae]